METQRDGTPIWGTACVFCAGSGEPKAGMM